MSIKKIIYCKKCVISNQRPSSVVEFTDDSIKNKETIFFDEDGVCHACKYAEIKKNFLEAWETKLSSRIHTFRSV